MNTIKLFKFLFFLSAFPLLLSSCKEDVLLTYEGETNIYFSLKYYKEKNGVTNYEVHFPLHDSIYIGKWTVGQNAIDSIQTSLAFDGTSEGQRIILVPVSISGNVVDYDREFGYVVRKETTATPGTNFEVLKAMVPANSITGAIAVSVDREHFQDTTMVMRFDLIPNEHFQTNYDKRAFSTSDTTKISMVNDMRLIVSSFLSQPNSWASYAGGPFTTKKMYLIGEITQGDIYDFYKSNPNLDVLRAWVSYLSAYLIEQRLLGTPIYEDDGTLMWTTATGNWNL